MSYGQVVPVEVAYACPSCGLERPHFQGGAARVIESRVEAGRPGGTRSLG